MDIDYVEPHGINIKVIGECPFIYTLVNYDMKRHRPTVSSDAFNTWSRRLSPQHTTMASEEGSHVQSLPAYPALNNNWTVTLILLPFSLIQRTIDYFNIISVCLIFQNKTI